MPWEGENQHSNEYAVNRRMIYKNAFVKRVYPKSYRNLQQLNVQQLLLIWEGLRPCLDNFFWLLPCFRSVNGICHAHSVQLPHAQKTRKYVLSYRI